MQSSVKEVSHLQWPLGGRQGCSSETERFSGIPESPGLIPSIAKALWCTQGMCVSVVNIRWSSTL